jgi:hypothetical protein
VSRSEPLPPPLPPETRTVGQLVAESVRLYGRHFWPSLVLGVPLAASDLVAFGGTVPQRIVVLLAFAPVFTAAYAWAAALVSGRRPDARRWVTTVVVGSLVFAPAALFFPWFTILSVAWLALVGLVVPVLVIEDVSPRRALRRAIDLGRADYVHALGSLATLMIVFILTRFALAFVLRAQADNTIRVSVTIADVVISPLIFLGAALLYVDQAARVRSRTAD